MLILFDILLKYRGSFASLRMTGAAPDDGGLVIRSKAKEGGGLVILSSAKDLYIYVRSTPA
jgi:hypothetical protein